MVKETEPQTHFQASQVRGVTNLQTDKPANSQASNAVYSKLVSVISVDQWPDMSLLHDQWLTLISKLLKCSNKVKSYITCYLHQSVQLCLILIFP